jgi:hypothetical protein
LSLLSMLRFVCRSANGVPTLGEPNKRLTREMHDERRRRDVARRAAQRGTGAFVPSETRDATSADPRPSRNSNHLASLSTRLIASSKTRRK